MSGLEPSPRQRRVSGWQPSSLRKAPGAEPCSWGFSTLCGVQPSRVPVLAVPAGPVPHLGRGTLVDALPSGWPWMEERRPAVGPGG